MSTLSQVLADLKQYRQIKVTTPRPPRIVKSAKVHTPVQNVRFAQRIVKEVCARRGINITQVMGKYRYIVCVQARQEIFYELRKIDWSYPKIGAYFKMDHTSIFHGVKVYEKSLGVSMKYNDKEAVCK